MAAWMPPPANGHGRPILPAQAAPSTRRVKAATGAHFLWFVSFVRAKEMNEKENLAQNEAKL